MQSFPSFRSELSSSGFSHIITNEGTVRWDALIQQASSKPPNLITLATPSLDTLRSILSAVYYDLPIVLLDPTISSHQCFQIKQIVQTFVQNTKPSFCIFLLTSGTSGLPKIVLLSGEALLYSALGAISFFSIDQDSFLPLTLPLHHVSGLMVFLRALLARSTLYLNQNRLSETLFSLKTSITHLSLIRTHAINLIEQGILEQLSHLRCVLLGGSSFPNHVLEKFASFPFETYSCYGMTETAAVIWAYSLRRQKGAVLPYRTLYTQENKLYVGGNGLFSGYLLANGSLETPFQNGFFETNDYAFFDPTTEMLTIHGRSDDIFLFGGENISTNELEEQIMQIDGVVHANVLPLPSTRYGHVPLAIIATSIETTFDGWQEKFSLVLPKAKLPKVVITMALSCMDAPGYKQKLARLKKEIRERLTNFEVLEEEEKLQNWNFQHTHE